MHENRSTLGRLAFGPKWDIAEALIAHPTWSDRRIYRLVGCHRDDVQKIRDFLESIDAIPSVEYLIGSDGKRRKRAPEYVTGTPEERFWRYVTKTDDCWVWTGSSLPTGYGQFSTGQNRQAYAHRFSYEIHKGPIPAGMYVCHQCDHPPCVRPDHLFLGTHAENMRDMARKGRGGRGRLIAPSPA